MPAAFEFTTTIKNLLFENVNISTVTGLIIACILITLLSGIYELIHFFRQYLIYKTKSSCQIPLNESSQLCCKDEPIRTTVKIQIHCAQSLLHMVQVLIGYIIMLCVMTFNAFFLLCVLLAIGIVYFMLGTLIPKYMDFPDEVCIPNNPKLADGNQSYSSINKEEETLRTE
uniref:Copper transport protein n=1 Tax=Strigamia maritima TaxID=126957 RepID=T1IYV7_STRMM